MAIAKRRKYRFPSRADAESAYSLAEQELIDQLRLARALYTGRITWLACKQPYRFGIFDEHTPGGPRFVMVSKPIRSQQEPDLQVIDAWGYGLDELERRAAGYADDESQALMECIGKVRQHMRTR